MAKIPLQANLTSRAALQNLQNQANQIDDSHKVALSSKNDNLKHTNYNTYWKNDNIQAGQQRLLNKIANIVDNASSNNENLKNSLKGTVVSNLLSTGTLTIQENTTNIDYSKQMTGQELKSIANDLLNKYDSITLKPFTSLGLTTDQALKLKALDVTDPKFLANLKDNEVADLANEAGIPLNTFQNIVQNIANPPQPQQTEPSFSAQLDSSASQQL
ncbi:MAG: hypothetical protein AAGE61_07095 [Pseudomonadota bacterium]